MLAIRGYNVHGLDVSVDAVETANRFGRSELASPAATNFAADEDTTTLASHGHGPGGSFLAICGDFFSRDWEQSEVVEGGNEGYDLIYDYTVSICTLRIYIGIHRFLHKG